VSTVKEAMLLAAPAIGVCVVVIPEVVFGLTPGALLVTAKLIEQLPFAGMVIPLKLNAAAPAASAFGVVPTQLPVTAPATALMLLSVSIKAAPVSAAALELLSVNVTVDVPPGWIVTGANALAIVGAATTFRLAVLLAVPATGVCIVVTPEVALGCTPAVLLVTAKLTVQLPLAGMVMPLKVSAVAPALSTLVPAPAQLPPAAPPAALILASVSANAAPVSTVEELLLFKVTVTVEFPPAWIDAGANAFATVGAARTVRFALLLAAPADGVCVVVMPDV
jgi:hypothetical protein